MDLYKIYYFSNQLHLKKIPFIPKFISYIIRLIFGCWIPYSSSIGRGTKFGYGGIGIVIHSRAIIGDNCLINSGVTVGGTSHKLEVPIIGDNVLIGSGAKILGNVRIGNNVAIGANAVVTKNIPDNCLVVGVPGQIIKTNIDIQNYL